MTVLWPETGVEGNRSTRNDADRIATRFEEQFKEAVEVFARATEEEIQRLDVLMDETGTEMNVDCAPAVFEVAVTVPQMNAFLQALESLDHLVTRLDALWLNGNLERKEKSRATRKWEGMLREITANTFRTYEEMKRLSGGGSEADDGASHLGEVKLVSGESEDDGEEDGTAAEDTDGAAEADDG